MRYYGKSKNLAFFKRKPKNYLNFALSYNGVMNLRADFKNGKPIEEIAKKYNVTVLVAQALIKTDFY